MTRKLLLIALTLALAIGIQAQETNSEGGKSDAYDAVVNFRKLTKEQRNQVIYFIESI